METQLAAQPTQGEQPKSAVQVVANVLERNNKKSAFLQNVGMQTKRPRMSAQLEAEKRENAELRLIVSNQREQMEGLSKQVQETELTRIRDKEEMSKKQAELEAKLELVLGQHGLR
jgi:16S rRNA G527 N7-methylase RsmG